MFFWVKKKCKRHKGRTRRVHVPKKRIKKWRLPLSPSKWQLPAPSPLFLPYHRSRLSALGLATRFHDNLQKPSLSRRAVFRSASSSSMDNPGRQQPSPVNIPVPTEGTSSRIPKRVVVCGGGVIGVCTAYFLARKAGNSVSITIVERSSVAGAASGKAGGFLALDWCDSSPLSQLARTSFRLHQQLGEELEGKTNYGYRPLDTLSLSFFQSNQHPPSKRNPIDLPSWVDGKFSGVPKTIGTTATTAQVHPKLFTETLLSDAVQKYGVQLVIGEVMDLGIEDGRVNSVTVKRRCDPEPDGGIFTIDAEAVVLAMGPWSGKLGLVSNLLDVTGIKAHSIVLRPESPEEITPHALFLSYTTSHGKCIDPEVYPRPTGEVYICGMSEEDAPVPEDPSSVLPRPEAIETLKGVATTVSSRLGGSRATIEAEQACFLPCSPDGQPVIGSMPGVEGLFLATGHSCWGILNGPATGAAVAELLLDGRSTIVDLEPFSPSRFLRRPGR